MFPAPAWRGSTPAERIREPLVEQKKSLPYFVLEALLEHLSSKTKHNKRHPSVKECLGRAVTTPESS
jgi:hypothetical protein